MESAVENKINLCIALNLTEKDFSEEDFKSYYQKVIKNLLKFLYRTQHVKMTFCFSGQNLIFIKNNFPEAFDLLTDLLGRQQVEITGGGFYSPIMPLLFPADRTGQIERLTAALHSYLSRRPRGMTLYGNIWDPSLISTIQSSGMEYVLLDSSLIPESKTEACLPLITSDMGKSVKVIPFYNELLPANDESLASWTSRIKDKTQEKQNAIVTLSFGPEAFEKFFNSPLFKFIDEENQKEHPLFELTLPLSYLKTADEFVSTYIPAGMSPQISDWAESAFKRTPNQSHFQRNIFDFIQTYPQTHQLYERMMYVCMILNQGHGDKIRKKSAREALWKAQTGSNFISLPDGLPSVNSKRQDSYKNLVNAEKFIREATDFKEALTRYDYNYDGKNEYICQMQKFNAVISTRGGIITSLDVMSSGYNYASNLSRIEEFDGQSDDYERGIFVEHILDDEEFEKYTSAAGLSHNVFSNINFIEKKFDVKRNEIQLEGRGEVFAMKQGVLLRKKIIVSSGGFVVQYILKNDSPFPLKGYFAVETNFNRSKPDSTQEIPFEAEVIYNTSRKNINADKKYTTDSGISMLKLNDAKAKLSFIMEPNESCGYLFHNINFKRPVLGEKGSLKNENVSNTAVNSFFWKVDLAAGMEMEKTINFSIVSEIKNKK